MSKINKLNTLAETKFLSLYNAEYSNKGGNTKNWTIASRKEKKNLLLFRDFCLLLKSV